MRVLRADAGAPAALVYAGLGVLCVVAFWTTAPLYGGYAIEAQGTNYVPPRELQFLLWFTFWGSLAVAAFSAALARTTLPGTLQALLDAPANDPRRALVLLGGFVFLVPLALRHALLLDQPICDDELTNDFITATLLEGRIVNPVPFPEGDRSYLQTQFIVVGDRGWYGKYSLGHPLLLAPFALLGRLDLAGSVFALGTFATAYLVGRRLFGDTRAALGAMLLALSPHFILTHATRVSQTSSGLCLMLALLGATRLLGRGDRGGLAVAAGTGLALGLGFFVRPMPGALFIVLLGLLLLVSGRHRRFPSERRVTWPELALVAAVAALGVLGVLATNQVQSGNPFSSGYQQLHTLGFGVGHSQDGAIPSSVGAALVRQNAWLFGWPLGLALLPFARPRRHAALLWAPLLAALLYRVIVPKTVVATTGPIYLTEVVPLLALASADGAARLIEGLERLSKGAGRWVPAVMLASFLVASALFLPVVTRATNVGAARRAAVLELFERETQGEVVVFANFLVPPELAVTWAYFPPVPSPSLDDRVLFLHLQPSRAAREAAWHFWRERFPQRAAYFYLPIPGRGARFERWSPERSPNAPPAPPPAAPTL
jgi:hypothetical protein